VDFNMAGNISSWITSNKRSLSGYFLGLGLIIISLAAEAEFDPSVLSKSTVQIFIKNKQGTIGTSTGFLWQTNTQIVTSLHVLSNDPSSKIIVEFGNIKRRATVKAVLAYADLVLLEIKKPIAGWQPLLDFNPIKPKYKAEVSALGFNRGSIGMITRELRKGYVTPEVLQVLLPPAALKSIIRNSQLDIKLPIYYMDGSLLPGYSGSPIVNSQGILIGIGNGGLENGASSVSWVIPATNLDALVKSETSQLSKSQNTLSDIFSADKLGSGKGKSIFHLSIISDYTIHFWQYLLEFLVHNTYAQPSLSPELSPLIEVNYRQFNFVKVKSRTYDQLLSSSDAPTNMDHVFNLYNYVFNGYKVDYKKFIFDIYEDGRFGLNIAVPHGVELTVDSHEFLVAQGNMFCRTCDYSIQYHARQLMHENQMEVQKSPILFLNGAADRHWQDLNEEGDYGEYRDFRTIESFGGQRYVLRAAYSNFSEPFINQFELNYFTAATNRDAWFQAQGILNRFDDKFFDALDEYRGTDCTIRNLPLKQAMLCRDIETMLTVLISVHLTSFSNKYFDN